MLRKLVARLLTRSDFLYGILRSVWPIAVLPGGGVALISRRKDVAEVLENKDFFRVPYAEKIRVIMGGGNIFLGKDEDPERAEEKALMLDIMPPSEAVSFTKPRIARLTADVIAGADGRLDIAMQLTQRVTTRFFGAYFGLPGPTDDFTYSDWARLLFEFQFVDRSNDRELRRRVDCIAPKLRDYVDEAISARKGAMGEHDDLLERCLVAQNGRKPLTDLQIRNNLIGCIVGGFPQPPMIVPQLIDVLLDRPKELAAAQKAAQADDDDLLARYVFEALRFFPLTPGLFRSCARAYTVANGTKRAKEIPEGALTIALTRSAMHDPRELAKPREFRTDRDWSDYMHFGWGPHECFGVFVNKCMTPAICKAVLRLPNLRRAKGESGQLQMEGPFAKSLVVEYDS